MVIDRDFFNTLNQSITITPYTGVDEDGEVSFGNDVTYNRCRVTYQTRTFRAASDSVEVLGSQIYVWTEDEISSDDKLTLSDGTSPEILSVIRVHDDDGTYYYTLIDAGRSSQQFRPL